MKYLLAILLSASFSFAKADYINDGRHQYYGKVVFIDQKTIKLQINCTGEIRSFSWDSILGLTFDNQCSNSGQEWSSSPATADLKCKKKTVFTIKFRKLGDASFADTVKLDKQKLYVHFINGKGSVTLKGTSFQDKIEWVMTEEKCLDDLKKPFPVPVDVK